MNNHCNVVRNFGWQSIGNKGIVAALVLLTLIGCGRKSAPRSAESASGSVTTVHPTRQTITRLIQQPAYVKSIEETPIYAKIPGFVEEIMVDKGSVVKKNDPLLKMWVPELEKDLVAKEERVKQTAAEINQAQATLQAADANINTAVAVVNEAKAGVLESEASLERWQAEYDRAMKLKTAGVYDLQTRDEAKSQMQQSTAGVARAKAKVASSEAALVESKAKREKAAADVTAAQARYQVAVAEKGVAAAWLDYRNLRAPFDGVVTMRYVNTGAFLQSSSSGSTNKAAEPVFVVMRTDIMRVTSQIPEYDAVLVKPGLPAHIQFPSLPGLDYPATVTLTSKALDEQARTLLTECHLSRTDKQLTPGAFEKVEPGLYGNVTITAQLPDVLTLPSAALMTDGDKKFCYVVEAGKAVRTNVKVGIETRSITQVLQKQTRQTNPGTEGEWEAFTGQEDIVARNPASLIDGQTVQVKPAGSP